MKRNLGFILLLVSFALVAAGSMGNIALGRSHSASREEQRCFASLEEGYLDRVHQTLEEAGLTQAGVTLTHVREADGSRVYTLRIHHQGYGRMKEESRKALESALAECAFCQEGCSFSQKFDWDENKA